MTERAIIVQECSAIIAQTYCTCGPALREISLSDHCETVGSLSYVYVQIAAVHTVCIYRLECFKIILKEYVSRIIALNRERSQQKNKKKKDKK